MLMNRKTSKNGPNRTGTDKSPANLCIVFKMVVTSNMNIVFVATNPILSSFSSVFFYIVPFLMINAFHQFLNPWWFKTTRTRWILNIKHLSLPQWTHMVSHKIPNTIRVKATLSCRSQKKASCFIEHSIDNNDESQKNHLNSAIWLT